MSISINVSIDPNTILICYLQWINMLLIGNFFKVQRARLVDKRLQQNTHTLIPKTV